MDRLYIRSASLVVALTMLAGCGAQQPIGAPRALPQSHAMATYAKRSGSCPQYLECVKLAYGSPIEQEWCVPAKGPLGFGQNCDPTSYGTWTWHTKVRGHRHHAREWIDVSVDPNRGNPVELTISESQRIKPSHGRIVYVVSLETCTLFSGGENCRNGWENSIGISTG